MTVDTVVKIVESEKCGLDMSSYEDLHSSDVGGGDTINGNNDNVSSDCNGDGKDDYVFVNGSDVAASSNDHVENHAKLTADGDVNVNVKDNVNVDVVEEELRVDNGVNLGEENREIESRSEDVVVDVASSNDHVENHAKLSADGEINVDVVEEESEVDNSGNLGEENREIESRSEDVVVDVASSNDHVENHAKLSTDGEINVDVVEEESKVDNGVNLGEENREIESRSEDVAVDAASSNDHVENHAKLSADGEVNVDAVGEESKVDNGVNLGEENREIESRSDGVVVDGISSDVNGDSVEESGVDEVKESDDLNDVADEVKEDESVFESGDNGNAAVVDSRDFDVDENNKSSVFDGQEVAEVKEEESVEGNGVADVSEPSEIESGIHDAVTEVAEGGLEAERHDIATCETERDVTENNGVVPTVDAPVTELKSESLETDVSDPSVENGLAEARSLAGEVKDEGLQLDVAAAEEHSFDDQQLHVAPAEGESEKRDSIEVDAKTEQLGVMDPSAGEESRESMVSEVAVSGESMVSNSGSKPEETTEDESLPNQSEGAETEGNQEIDVPEKENQVPIIARESDESEIVPTNGVEENGTAVAAADAQFGATDKSGLEDESELIDGEGEGESEVTGEIGGSQESSPEECVLHNQVAEQTQSFDVVDENISSEDYVSEKDPTIQDATNLSEQQSVEQTGSSDVVDEKISSEDCSSERNLTSEDTTNLSEQQFEEQTGSTGVVVEKTSSEDCIVEKNLTSEETNLSEQQSADNTAVDVDRSDDGGSHSKDDVSENKVVPASVESSEDAASDLRSEDEGMKLDSVEEVPPPSDVDNLNKRQVAGEVSSAADNPSSGSCDDTSSQTKLETDNDSSPSPVTGTNSEAKTVKSEFDSAIKSNKISDETVKPNISFGSFGDDLMNKSTAVSAVNGEALLHSAVNGDHPEVAQPEQIDNVSASSAEGSEIETSEVQNNSNPDLVRRPFCWLVKVPRFDEGKYKDQLRQGEIELAEKTKTRDGFQAEFSKQQAYCRELKSIRDSANTEVKAARELVWAKTREIDAAHSILNLARHAVTVEDIDNKIHNLEHTLQHQTLNNLKEEKELVREIKQLNLQRQKLTANPQRQQEVQQALNQRGETEEQLKVLKKELDGLRDNLSKADELFRAAKKKHDDEIMILNDIKQQLKSADDIRQEAYAHLKTIQKQLNEKNAPFYKAKNDLRVAYNYATAGKRDNLERHCVNQVEKLMEMWNKNDEFRKEYIQCNMRRTVWKFGTLDGTRLGINEVPPSLGNVSDNRVKTPTKVDAAAVTFTMDRDFPVQAKTTEVKPSKKVEQKVAPPPKAVEAKPPVIIEIEEEEVTETPKLTKEEEELARKAEQLRKEEEAARLREQRRLEEKAKAEEALERKRRNALKAQARAEFKARKEAEEKEKEREKRAKKKGKKKGIISETTENEPAQPSEPSSKVAKEREIVEKPASTTKKTQKVGLHSKPIKTTKPIPPALRSKGKRGLLRYWPYACVVLLAIALFYLGSYERIQAIKQFISGLFN